MAASAGDPPAKLRRNAEESKRQEASTTLTQQFLAGTLTSSDRKEKPDAGFLGPNAASAAPPSVKAPHKKAATQETEEDEPVPHLGKPSKSLRQRPAQDEQVERQRSQATMNTYMSKAQQLLTALRESTQFVRTMDDDQEAWTKMLGGCDPSVSLDTWLEMCRRRHNTERSKFGFNVDSNLSKYDKLHLFKEDADNVRARELLVPDQETEDYITEMSIALGFENVDGKWIRKCDCESKLERIRVQVKDHERRIAKAKYIQAFVSQLDGMVAYVDAAVEDLRSEEEQRLQDIMEIRAQNRVLVGTTERQKLALAKMKAMLKAAGIKVADDAAESAEKEAQLALSMAVSTKSKERESKRRHRRRGSEAGVDDAIKQQQLVWQRRLAALERQQMHALDFDSYEDVQAKKSKPLELYAGKTSVAVQSLTEAEVRQMLASRVSVAMPGKNQGGGSASLTAVPQSLQISSAPVLPVAPWTYDPTAVPSPAALLFPPEMRTVEVHLGRIGEAFMGALTSLEAARSTSLLQLAECVVTMGTSGSTITAPELLDRFQGVFSNSTCNTRIALNKMLTETRNNYQMLAGTCRLVVRQMQAPSPTVVTPSAPAKDAGEMSAFAIHVENVQASKNQSVSDMSMNASGTASMKGKGGPRKSVTVVAGSRKPSNAKASLDASPVPTRKGSTVSVIPPVASRPVQQSPVPPTDSGDRSQEAPPDGLNEGDATADVISGDWMPMGQTTDAAPEDEGTGAAAAGGDDAQRVEELAAEVAKLRKALEDSEYRVLETAGKLTNQEKTTSDMVAALMTVKGYIIEATQALSHVPASVAAAAAAKSEASGKGKGGKGGAPAAPGSPVVTPILMLEHSLGIDLDLAKTPERILIVGKEWAKRIKETALKTLQGEQQMSPPVLTRTVRTLHGEIASLLTLANACGLCGSLSPGACPGGEEPVDPNADPSKKKVSTFMGLATYASVVISIDNVTAALNAFRQSMKPNFTSLLMQERRRVEEPLAGMMRPVVQVCKEFLQTVGEGPSDSINIGAVKGACSLKLDPAEDSELNRLEGAALNDAALTATEGIEEVYRCFGEVLRAAQSAAMETEMKVRAAAFDVEIEHSRAELERAKAENMKLGNRLKKMGAGRGGEGNDDETTDESMEGGAQGHGRRRASRADMERESEEALQELSKLHLSKINEARREANMKLAGVQSEVTIAIRSAEHMGLEMLQDIECQQRNRLTELFAHGLDTAIDAFHSTITPIASVCSTPPLATPKHGTLSGSHKRLSLPADMEHPTDAATAMARVPSGSGEGQESYYVGDAEQTAQRLFDRTNKKRDSRFGERQLPLYHGHERGTAMTPPPAPISVAVETLLPWPELGSTASITTTAAAPNDAKTFATASTETDPAPSPADLVSKAVCTPPIVAPIATDIRSVVGSPIPNATPIPVGSVTPGAFDAEVRTRATVEAEAQTDAVRFYDPNDSDYSSEATDSDSYSSGSSSAEEREGEAGAAAGTSVGASGGDALASRSERRSDQRRHREARGRTAKSQEIGADLGGAVAAASGADTTMAPSGHPGRREHHRRREHTTDASPPSVGATTPSQEALAHRTTRHDNEGHPSAAAQRGDKKPHHRSRREERSEAPPRDTVEPQASTAPGIGSGAGGGGGIAGFRPKVVRPNFSQTDESFLSTLDRAANQQRAPKAGENTTKAETTPTRPQDRPPVAVPHSSKAVQCVLLEDPPAAASSASKNDPKKGKTSESPATHSGLEKTEATKPLANGGRIRKSDVEGAANGGKDSQGAERQGAPPHAQPNPSSSKKPARGSQGGPSKPPIDRKRQTEHGGSDLPARDAAQGATPESESEGEFDDNPDVTMTTPAAPGTSALRSDPPAGTESHATDLHTPARTAGLRNDNQIKEPHAGPTMSTAVDVGVQCNTYEATDNQRPPHPDPHQEEPRPARQHDALPPSSTAPTTTTSTKPREGVQRDAPMPATRTAAAHQPPSVPAQAPTPIERRANSTAAVGSQTDVKVMETASSQTEPAALLQRGAQTTGQEESGPAITKPLAGVTTQPAIPLTTAAAAGSHGDVGRAHYPDGAADPNKEVEASAAAQRAGMPSEPAVPRWTTFPGVTAASPPTPASSPSRPAQRTDESTQVCPDDLPLVIITMPLPPAASLPLGPRGLGSPTTPPPPLDVDLLMRLHGVLIGSMSEVFKRLRFKHRVVVDDPFSLTLHPPPNDILIHDYRVVSALHRLLHHDSMMGKRKVVTAMRQFAARRRLEGFLEVRKNLTEEDEVPTEAHRPVERPTTQLNPAARALLDRNERRLREALQQLDATQKQLVHERRKAFETFSLPSTTIAVMPSRYIQPIEGVFGSPLRAPPGAGLRPETFMGAFIQPQGGMQLPAMHLRRKLVGGPGVGGGGGGNVHVSTGGSELFMGGAHAGSTFVDPEVRATDSPTQPLSVASLGPSMFAMSPNGGASHPPGTLHRASAATLKGLTANDGATLAPLPTDTVLVGRTAAADASSPTLNPKGRKQTLPSLLAMHHPSRSIPGQSYLRAPPPALSSPELVADAWMSKPAPIAKRTDPKATPASKP